MFIIYATAEKGYGASQEIGKFEDIEDIEIRLEIFDKDTVITIGEDK
jgi:hypothetical protein